MPMGLEFLSFSNRKNTTNIQTSIFNDPSPLADVLTPFARNSDIFASFAGCNAYQILIKILKL
jgi:hypothetical protein